MISWNFDISAAPRGKTVTVTRKVKTSEGVVDRQVEETRQEKILAVHADRTVVQSYWMPPRYTQSGAVLDGNRWSGFNVGSDPIAWAPWPVFEFAVPASEQSEGNGSRDHQHVHSRQTDGAKHGGQDGEAAAADHATHQPETASETMGGTGDDCSFGNRGVWPPQGGASSSRGNDSLSVVTAGETASNYQSDGGEFAAVKAQGRLADPVEVEPSPSGLIIHKHIFLEDVGGGV